jgi:hypothetical protein
VPKRFGCGDPGKVFVELRSRKLVNVEVRRFHSQVLAVAEAIDQSAVNREIADLVGEDDSSNLFRRRRQPERPGNTGSVRERSERTSTVKGGRRD